MRTIFIPIFSGIEGKNVLRGGIFESLRERGFEAVFFVGNHTRAEYYRREYPSVRFEVIKRYRRLPLDRFFSALKFFTLRTKTIDMKRRTNLERRGSYPRFILSFLTNRILSNYLVRRCVRFFDERLVRDDTVENFFDKYKPELVFLADLFEDTEISMLRSARRRGISSVGFLSTWDRLTSRWGIRILPDYLVVFNGELRSEAIEYADMPAEKIFVSGAVQLDLHLKKKPILRDDFLKHIGLPTDTKIILYGPLGRTFDPSKQSDTEVVALLNKWAGEGKFGVGSYKIIVRFPPNDFVDTAILPKLTHVIYDVPGVRFASIRGQDWDMRPSELDHLRDLLANTDVVVCYYSSLSIDASVFDVPVININFDLHNETKRHPYYETAHYSKVARLGGIRLVTNPDELHHAIREYIENPSRDREGRKAVVSQQAYRLDGKSAERIAEFVSKVASVKK